MRIIAGLRTVDFRGDHAADTFLLYEIAPGETVEHLCSRLVGHNKYIQQFDEVVELRVVVELEKAETE